MSLCECERRVWGEICVGMGSRIVDQEPRPREPRVTSHTICLRCALGSVISASLTVLGMWPALDLVF